MFRRRFIPPPDPSRVLMLGDIGDESPEPFEPDVDEMNAELACVAVGGVWVPDMGDGRAPGCELGIPVCNRAGGVWDYDREECVFPDGPPDGLPPGFVSPGPTKIHIQAWDADAEPYARYQLQWGDTYVGLAKTYLDKSGARWPEIWNLNRAQHPNPSAIYVSQVINMPDEARDNYLSWLNRGGPSGELPSEQKGSTLGSKLPWIVGGVALAAGGLYLVSKRRRVA